MPAQCYKPSDEPHRSRRPRRRDHGRRRRHRPRDGAAHGGVGRDRRPVGLPRGESRWLGPGLARGNRVRARRDRRSRSRAHDGRDDGALRAHRHPRQRRGDHGAQDDDPRIVARGVEAHLRHQRDGHVPREPRGGPPHGRGGLRAHREPRLDRRQGRQSVQRRVLGVQGRGDLVHQVAWRRSSRRRACA